MKASILKPNKTAKGVIKRLIYAFFVLGSKKGTVVKLRISVMTSNQIPITPRMSFGDLPKIL